MIYGFRRNLFGVKWLALALNLAVVGICLPLLWWDNWSWEAELGKRMIVVLAIAAVHATYILFAVRENTVWDAARVYARELILSCEAFFGAPASKSPPSQRVSGKRSRAGGTSGST